MPGDPLLDVITDHRLPFFPSVGAAGHMNVPADELTSSPCRTGGGTALLVRWSARFLYT